MAFLVVVVQAILLFFNLWISGSYAAVAADEILSFPGWNQPLPSKQYGGYLSAEGGESHLFYMFVESERDPANDPIILWLNGGPGCSSLLGYFTEHGPFLPTSANTVELRDYRWSRMANIIYLESPVGVGFSYSDTNNYYNNDTRSVELNYGALQSFFTSYPEYKQNKFYIMGESYAGIYVPTLAQRVLQATDFAGPNLLGIAVGNGCTGTDTQTTCAIGPYCSGPNCPGNSSSTIMQGACAGFSLQVQYLNTISGPSIPSREAVRDNCNFTAVTLSSTFDNFCDLSMACSQALDSFYPYWTAIDAYNVFGACNNPNFTASFDTSCIQQGNPVLMHQMSFHARAKMTYKTQLKLSEVNGNRRMLASAYDDDTGATFDTDYWNSIGTPAFCLSEGPQIAEYLNNPDFISAVHAKAPATCWGACNDVDSFTYYKIVSNTYDIYLFLISKIKVLIFNGDFDSVVPYNDNYRWTSSLAAAQGYPVLKTWSSWQYTSGIDNTTQVGGYNIKWDTSSVGTGGTFEFRTVRAAGHTVPQDTPDKAYQVYAHFLDEGDGHYYYPATTACAVVADDDSDDMSEFEIATIVLAVVLGVTIIGIIIFLVLKKDVLFGATAASAAKGESHTTTNPLAI